MDWPIIVGPIIGIALIGLVIYAFLPRLRAPSEPDRPQVLLLRLAWILHVVAILLTIAVAISVIAALTQPSDAAWIAVAACIDGSIASWVAVAVLRAIAKALDLLEVLALRSNIRESSS